MRLLLMLGYIVTHALVFAGIALVLPYDPLTIPESRTDGGE